MADEEDKKSDEKPEEVSGEDQSTEGEESAEDSDSKESEGDGDEVSLDDIDAILAETDPAFEEQMRDIEENVKAVESQIQSEKEEELNRKKTFEERFPRIFKKVQPILRAIKPLIKFSQWVGHLFSKALAFTKASIKESKENLKTLKTNLPIYLGKAKGIALNAFSVLKAGGLKVVRLNKRQKALSVLMIAVIFAAVFLARKTWDGGIWIPFLKVRPVTTFIGLEDNLIVLKKPISFELYSEAFPQPEYTWLLKKIVVNLKRRVRTSTPMGAFEFYFNLDSKETAIEVKDREPQIIDQVQRVIEEFTYDELSTARGMDRMKGLVKSEINDMLNYGRIKSIYTNIKVLKP